MMQCHALAQLQPSNVDFKPREAVPWRCRIVVDDRRSSKNVVILRLVAFTTGLYDVETAMTGALAPKHSSQCTNVKLCDRAPGAIAVALPAI